MLYEGTRSKGEGIVQFAQTEEAQTAGERFTGYQYGGRPLGEFPVLQPSLYGIEE